MDRPENPFAPKNGEEFCPAVNPIDLKAAWELYHRTEKPTLGTSVTSGLGAVAVGVEGFQETCTPGAVAENVLYRAMMMQFLYLAVERQPEEPESKALAKLLKHELDERLFEVMARIPMRWIPDGGIQGFPFDLHGVVKQVEAA